MIIMLHSEVLHNNLNSNCYQFLGGRILPIKQHFLTTSVLLTVMFKSLSPSVDCMPLSILNHILNLQGIKHGIVT